MGFSSFLVACCIPSFFALAWLTFLSFLSSETLGDEDSEKEKDGEEEDGAAAGATEVDVVEEEEEVGDISDEDEVEVQVEEEDKEDEQLDADEEDKDSVVNGPLGTAGALTLSLSSGKVFFFGLSSLGEGNSRYSSSPSEDDGNTVCLGSFLRRFSSLFWLSTHFFLFFSSNTKANNSFFVNFLNFFSLKSIFLLLSQYTRDTKSKFLMLKN